MKKQEFNNDEFKRKLGITPRVLQPYNFERYRKINRNLTEDVYRQLRINGSEWKILCGLSVSTHWGNVILKEVWELKCDDYYKESDFYKFRYTPEKYLELQW
ncbi:hypothetical protein [Flavobacterium sp. UBA7680]|uniref:hypothetical protein n=1 Tax=Flavobacterium sp. UBA7680 TaxID=1946559 RepID=UPI0025BE6A95|nr:hypothetical protein [Flavobacterium sp. UBA7680]